MAMILIGTIAAVAGAGALLRTHRWRRGRPRPWRGRKAAHRGPRDHRLRAPGYDELTDEPVRLRLLTTAVWRTRAVQRMDGAEVRAAPVGGDQWVLTADGLDTVIGARTAARRRRSTP